ncbi:hypothetical protein CLAFUW4_00124 [Fulvia fulva]|uniref:BHLH domain-containing protein n=1 Tax=Passalora fulva TaxID=5499 RepID=A0A9Q8L7T5_PASFU|nr:uncharacterized protein CLAFUR5_00123 [Fulvia fulva]KAK4636042.1 hypothetical protein CLAFUR4_00124 [Fulvia fulva]KAK4638649.1 hypothetical protein CLAFUR0_00122 [Fulvia fulva]UJO12486.1 hypothetical protein CLAFUR5_00123 [Fulvia fulva]WPV09177.1 hypothetical protein CLAFUW4_00124 [Fulvia fulva]WPV25174.1 hypothetical protein CLAFUW7_00124 [Fulvia fulva]
MPVSSRDNLTTFPPFESQGKEAASNKRDSPLEFGLDDFEDNSDMASATSPFIKPEPNDFSFDSNQYMQYQGQNHMSNSGNMNVNPANLTNGNGYMSSSFNLGNASIADDELADLQIDQQGNTFDFNNGMQNYMHQQMGAQSGSVFSHTPDGGPIQSPFTSEFNYSQFRPVAGQQPQQFGGHSVPSHAMPPHLQHMDRKVSDSRSPATPNTPGMNHLTIGDDYHPGMQPIQHRQHSNIGWETTTPSAHSWDASSPFPSPNGQAVHHPQISEVLKTNTHHHKVASSLPTKMEPGVSGGPPFNTQEAKRRRRRESHNMVERRRRDNINERIHDLGTLVPQHRLEDEKVRKHLQTNAPLSPSIANASMSPPNPSLLGANGHRRSTSGAGTITQGLPMEEKDKGPNKGDILNGSVAWTRDMMWFVHQKLREEEQLKQLVSQLGGAWPFGEHTEEEKRMRSEIIEVLTKHQPVGGFSGYSRAPGSGLRVPGYTNIAGEPVGDAHAPNGQSIPPVSPRFQPGGSGMSSGMSHQQFNFNDFKEEDEYHGMEMQ